MIDNSNQSLESTKSTENRSSLLKQIIQLRHLAQRQIIKNQNILNELIKNDIEIDFQIYTGPLNSQKYIKNYQIQTQKKNLIQINDIILADALRLAKYQRKYTFKLQDMKIDQNQLNDQILKTYSFMRKVWTQIHQYPNNFDKGVGQFSAQNQLDRLNKIVYSLKNNTQKTLFMEIKNNRNMDNKIVDQILYNWSYEQLKQRYQRLRMQKEDREGKQSRYIQKILEQIYSLRQENSILKKDLIQQKEKLKKIQSKYLANQLKTQNLSQKYYKILNQEKKYRKSRILNIIHNYQIQILPLSQLNQKPKLSNQIQLVKQLNHRIQTQSKTSIQIIPKIPISIPSNKSFDIIDRSTINSQRSEKPAKYMRNVINRGGLLTNKQQDILNLSQSQIKLFQRSNNYIRRRLQDSRRQNLNQTQIIIQNDI